MKKKLFLSGIVAALISTLSFNAAATEYSLTGQIERLSTSDADISGEGKAHSSVRLKGGLPQSAGSCFVGSSGYLVIHIRDNSAGERMYTTLLAAQLASESVELTFNDDYKSTAPGRPECYLQRVRIEK